MCGPPPLSDSGTSRTPAVGGTGLTEIFAVQRDASPFQGDLDGRRRDTGLDQNGGIRAQIGIAQKNRRRVSPETENLHTVVSGHHIGGRRAVGPALKEYRRVRAADRHEASPDSRRASPRRFRDRRHHRRKAADEEPEGRR